MSSPTIDASRRFLAFLKGDSTPSDEQLARALDELTMAYHEAPEGDPADEDVEPPSREYEQYKRRYAELGAKFPDYGYYSVADWTEPLSKESVIADAIDDLADIEGDLDEVIWRAENLGVDDAHWYFRFLYNIHWGRHLRELSLYLYGRIDPDDGR